MDAITVAVHQPNLYPWLGYFHKMAKDDIFYLLDDVQMQKTGASYTNRVSIMVGGESRYITAPIRRSSGLWNINQAQFADRRWIDQALKLLQGAYSKAKYFRQERDIIFDLMRYETSNLSDYNINFITKLSALLGLKTELRKSSDLEKTTTDPTARLVELVCAGNGGVYLSGNGADAYQDVEAFRARGILVKYIDNSRFGYTQVGAESFVKGLSILDVIFNIGMDGASSLLGVQGD